MDKFSDQIAGLYARIDPQPDGRLSGNVVRVARALREHGHKVPHQTRLSAWKSNQRPSLIPINRLLDLCDVAGISDVARNTLIVRWANESRRLERAATLEGEGA